MSSLTPELEQLILELVIVPNDVRRLSPADFVARSGIDDLTQWSLRELHDAIRRQDGDDLEYVLIVSAVFGKDRRWAAPFQELLLVDWHRGHEAAAFDLARLGDSESIPALMHAAFHVPDYLLFDEARALASKAIHSLGAIPGPEAEAALRALLTTHEDRPLRATTQRVLDRRLADPPRLDRLRVIYPGSDVQPKPRLVDGCWVFDTR